MNPSKVIISSKLHVSSKENRFLLLIAMLAFMMYVFLMPIKISNSAVKEQDFHVSVYSVENCVIAEQPYATAYFAADSEEAATLRKLIRSNPYRVHRMMRNLYSSEWQITADTTKMVRIESTDKKFLYEVLDTGDVNAVGTLMHMGYWNNAAASSFVEKIIEMIQ